MHQIHFWRSGPLAVRGLRKLARQFQCLISMVTAERAHLQQGVAQNQYSQSRDDSEERGDPVGPIHRAQEFAQATHHLQTLGGGKEMEDAFETSANVSKTDLLLLCCWWLIISAPTKDRKSQRVTWVSKRCTNNKKKVDFQFDCSYFWNCPELASKLWCWPAFNDYLDFQGPLVTTVIEAEAETHREDINKVMFTMLRLLLQKCVLWGFANQS